jgi:ADP-glucose pyrophosphorylase
MAVQRTAEEPLHHPVPAQMRSEDETWYQGTADAILQNINLIQQSDTHLVAIFGGDHIYRMNIASMIDFHMARHAEVTVAAIPLPAKSAAEFGVIEANETDASWPFTKKSPCAHHARRSQPVYASMGNYIFSKRTLVDLLTADANDPAVITISARTFCPNSPATPPSTLTTSRPTASPASRGLHSLLARCRHHRRLLRSQHGPALRQA